MVTHITKRLELILNPNVVGCEYNFIDGFKKDKYFLEDFFSQLQIFWLKFRVYGTVLKINLSAKMDRGWGGGEV